MNIVISSGHGKYVRGASGYIDEVDEARRVTEQVADLLRDAGATVWTFHDNTSHDVNTNLKTITSFHNSKTRSLDISVHFNKYETTSKAMGCEVLYVTQEELAAKVSSAIAKAGGLKDRGGKYRSDLYVLNNTEEPCIMLEVCFVDSSHDVDNCYRPKFQAICAAIAGAVYEPEPELPEPFDQKEIAAISEIAMRSPLAKYDWEDRGVAPSGYIKGMALAYGTVFRKWNAGDSAAREMAKADIGDEENDALAWYADEFEELEMDNASAGVDTLRHLFALMIGLGMRESSGRHCEGRDMSADNVSSDTAEAGLFQTSWNINTCSDEIEKIFELYSPALEDDLPQCYLSTFQDDVSCTQSEWSSYGSGTGRDYQDLSKSCPPMHIEITAIGLRNRRQHWGPINRGEVELLTEADEMLMAVQKYLSPETV